MGRNPQAFRDASHMTHTCSDPGVTQFFLNLCFHSAVVNFRDGLTSPRGTWNNPPHRGISRYILLAGWLESVTIILSTSLMLAIKSSVTWKFLVLFLPTQILRSN